MMIIVTILGVMIRSLLDRTPRILHSLNGIRIEVDRRAIRFSSLHLFAKISEYLFSG